MKGIPEVISRRAFVCLIALFLLCVFLPGKSMAQQSILVSSGSLEEAMEANPTAALFTVTGTVAACDIPAGITVEVAPEGKLAGASFYNAGTVIGAYSGVIFNEGDVSQVTEATIRIPGPVANGVVSTLYYDENTLMEGAVYHKNKLWILPEHSVSSAVIGNGFYWADNVAVGQAMTCSISYRMGDGSESLLVLDPDVYPASFQVMTVDQVIPAGPSIDGAVFESWLCAGLAGGQTLTIPAGTNQDLILYYQAQGKSGSSGGPGSGSFGSGFGGLGSAFSGGSGSNRGSISAGSTGAGSISTLPGSDDEENKTQQTQTPSNIMTSAGGMRIRTANSGTRRVITDDGGQGQTIGQSIPKKASFPWHWTGLSLGLLLLLILGIMALKKRAEAKTAAMYEKLNIH